MSVDRKRPKNFRKAPVTEYRCQFCMAAHPVGKWKETGDVCPSCGKKYDAVSLMDCDDEGIPR